MNTFRGVIGKKVCPLPLAELFNQLITDLKFKARVVQKMLLNFCSSFAIGAERKNRREAKNASDTLQFKSELEFKQFSHFLMKLY